MFQKIIKKYLCVPMPTYQSRWGFHCCNYETYRKLKFLHKKYYEALRKLARWRRWKNKMPHNRVKREKIRNRAGQVVGYKALVQVPEPPLCSVFTRRTNEDAWMINEKYIRDYHIARLPSPSPDKVYWTVSNEEEIDKVYQELQNEN